MSSRERVLVVDDDRDCREGLRTILGEAGFLVETASSAPEALGRLSAFPADVVLSDLEMPGMTGLDFIKALRARGQRQPVVLLTGAETRDLCTCAEAYGAAACLRKPVDVDDLIWTLDCAVTCQDTPPVRRQSSRGIRRNDLPATLIARG